MRRIRGFFVLAAAAGVAWPCAHAARGYGSAPPAATFQSAVADVARVREWAAADPDAFWPRWARGESPAWTAAGVPGADAVVYVAPDGAVGGSLWPFTLSVWVRDDGTGRWIAPEVASLGPVRMDLRSGYLPLPRLSFGDGGWTVELEVAVADAGSAFPDGLAVVRARLANGAPKPRSATLAVAVRPYRVDARLGAVRSLGWERDVVWVNEAFPVAADRVPARRVESALDCDGADLSRRLLDEESSGSVSPGAAGGGAADAETGGAPRPGGAGASAADPCPGSDLRAGAFLFPVRVGSGRAEALAVTVPVRPVARGPGIPIEVRRPGAEELLARAAARWRARALGLPLAVPDSTVLGALRAALATLQMSVTENGEARRGPGVEGYDLRVAAHAVPALLRWGLAQPARAAVERLWASQREDGTFALAASDARDAPGQAIFLLAELVRFTGDTAAARKRIAAVERAARALARWRAPMAHDSMRGTVAFGLLPASVAPPELGGTEGHHYWDDVWAVRGLRDAAWLAGLAGHAADSAAWAAEADAVARAVRVSARQAILVSRKEWIPLAPEHLDAPGAARSTCEGLWPAAGFEAADTLVRASFDRYWEMWLAPRGGALEMGGVVWTHGIALGGCAVRLDRPARAHAILRRHLMRPTVPGTWGWAERVDPETFAYAGGALPGAWPAAEYALLVRALAAYEEGDTLVLGAGLLPAWLHAGVALRAAPTALGLVTAEARLRGGTAGPVVWAVEAPARAKALRIAAPAGGRLREAVIDGGWRRALDGARSVVVPPDVRTVELHWEPVTGARGTGRGVRARPPVAAGSRTRPRRSCGCRTRSTRGAR